MTTQPDPATQPAPRTIIEELKDFTALETFLCSIGCFFVAAGLWPLALDVGFPAAFWMLVVGLIGLGLLLLAFWKTTIGKAVFVLAALGLGLYYLISALMTPVAAVPFGVVLFAFALIASTKGLSGNKCYK